MPQDTEGSGLVSLLWVALVYWSIYWWLARPSLLEHTEKERQRSHPSGPSRNTSATSPLAVAAMAANLEALVSEILRRDGTTAVEDFLNERLFAYEMIVAAFDCGDREMLRGLVSPDVYDAFSDAIAARETQQQEIETVFSRIDPPQIVDGLIDEAHMEVSVRFVGECFKLCRSARGDLINGTPDICRSVDIWTFARMLSSRERTWRVVTTEAGA